MTTLTTEPPVTQTFPIKDTIWCAACGHFSVLNALDGAFGRLGIDGKDALIVAGIGCSGTVQNHVRAYGYHALHGRALPSAAGAKMANPELTVIAAGGDGDGLAVGGGHLMHTFRNNPSIAYIIMNNSTYGLTKGQASPTTEFGVVTPTTPYGKLDDPMNPLLLYLSSGVRYVVSAISTQPRVLARAIGEAMDYPGFAMVHVQSPCTTYNDTYEALKGNPDKGIDPGAWDIPESHDPSNLSSALDIAQQGGIPIGLLYRAHESIPMHDRLTEARERTKARQRTVDEMLDTLAI